MKKRPGLARFFKIEPSFFLIFSSTTSFNRRSPCLYSLFFCPPFFHSPTLSLSLSPSLPLSLPLFHSLSKSIYVSFLFSFSLFLPFLLDQLILIFIFCWWFVWLRFRILRNFIDPTETFSGKKTTFCFKKKSFFPKKNKQVFFSLSPEIGIKLFLNPHFDIFIFPRLFAIKLLNLG